MARHRRPTTSTPRVPGKGLALPTIVAALVCGGSILAIGAGGAIAMDTGPLAAGAYVDVAGPALASSDAGLPAGAPPAGPGATSGSAPAVGEPVAAAPPEAATGRDHSITVHGPGYDLPEVPAPLARGPLGPRRVVAAAVPTVIVLDPEPAPSGPSSPVVSSAVVPPVVSSPVVSPRVVVVLGPTPPSGPLP